MILVEVSELVAGSTARDVFFLAKKTQVTFPKRLAPLPLKEIERERDQQFGKTCSSDGYSVFLCGIVFQIYRLYIEDIHFLSESPPLNKKCISRTTSYHCIREMMQLILPYITLHDKAS